MRNVFAVAISVILASCGMQRPTEDPAPKVVSVSKPCPERKAQNVGYGRFVGDAVYSRKRESYDAPGNGAVIERIEHHNDCVVVQYHLASAIEARSGETTQIGSTEGESAVAKPDAQGPAR